MKAESIKGSVYDASMILALLLPDEKIKRNYSREKLKKLLSERVYCPRLVDSEVGNALIMAKKRKRLSGKGVKFIWENFKKLKIVRQDFNQDCALNLAMKFDLTYYDCSYLELALERKSQLVTLDKRLERIYNLYIKSGKESIC